MSMLPNAHASILIGDIVGSSRNNKIVILLFIQLTQVLQHNIALPHKTVTSVQLWERQPLLYLIYCLLVI